MDWVWENIKERGPELWLWHTPKTAMKNRADWIDYADGFLLASWPLEKEEGELLIELEKEFDQAMSHGFFKSPLGYDAKEGIINIYRSFEGSALPREFVANEWTDFATLMQEEKEMFTEEKRGYLVAALGEEKVAELEGSTKDMAEELKALGIEFKEAEKPAEEPAKESTTEKVEEGKAVEAKVDADEVVAKLGIPALSEYLEKQDKFIKGLVETTKALVEKVDELSKSEDEKIAEKLTPRFGQTPIWLRASDSKETEVKEGEEIPKGPGNEGSSWVSDALGGITPDAAAQPR